MNVHVGDVIRIKTLKEFEKEFGRGGRWDVRDGWCSDMDRFMGRRFIVTEVWYKDNRLGDSSYLRVKFIGGGVHFWSEDMFVVVRSLYHNDIRNFT